MIKMQRPNPADIDIISTGGHFEKRKSQDGALVYEPASNSFVEDMLAEVLGPAAAIKTAFLKDSSTFTDEDRRLICEQVEHCPMPRVVVLHGTSTLDETARFLFQMNLQKTIVLTGTTRRMDERPSEAFFNLGAAIGLVQAMPYGVYGVMNGRIIPPMSLRKDPVTGRYDTASGEHLSYTPTRQS